MELIRNTYYVTTSELLERYAHLIPKELRDVLRRLKKANPEYRVSISSEAGEIVGINFLYDIDIIGFSSKVDSEDYELVMRDSYFKKGDIIKVDDSDRMTRVKKVYKNNWWTRLMFRFGQYLINRFKIEERGVRLKLEFLSIK